MIYHKAGQQQKTYSWPLYQLIVSVEALNWTENQYYQRNTIESCDLLPLNDILRAMWPFLSQLYKVSGGDSFMYLLGNTASARFTRGQ